MDRDDFITLEIVPTLGDYASDYDLEGICDEVAEYDGNGFVWKPQYVDDIDAYNAVLQRHDVS